jgi:PKD domain-containing protein
MTAALALALVAAAAPSNYAPQPLIEWAEADHVKPGATVTFDSSASSDPDGTIVAREWDLDDDGAFDDGTGVTASRTFATTGTHVVRLRVTDDKGLTARGETRVRVDDVNVPPQPRFTVEPDPPVVGKPVRFDASRSVDPDGDGIALYEWDFDRDDEVDHRSTTPTATHTWERTGGVRVKLWVTDGRGSRQWVHAPLEIAKDRPLVELGGPRMAVVKGRFAVRGPVTRVRSLVATRVARGVTATLSCAGPGCTLTSRRLAVRRGRANAGPALAGARLRPGAKVTIALRMRHRRPKVVTYTMRRGSKPAMRDRG